LGISCESSFGLSLALLLVTITLRFSKKEALRPLRFRKPLNKGLVFLTWLGVFLSAVASPVKAA